MSDRVMHLLRNVILVFAFGAGSCVMARPVAALQVVLGPPVATDKPSGTGQYTLSGTVVDALTGAPIRRALVALMGVQSQAVLTDEGGKFRFENLAQGQGMIYAHKPGYTDSSRESPTRVTIGGDTSPLVLKLDPESAIVVKVTGEDGEGVEGLPVRVLMSQVQEGRRYWNTQGGGQTDEQGEYRAGNLRPGKYYRVGGAEFSTSGTCGGRRSRERCWLSEGVLSERWRIGGGGTRRGESRETGAIGACAEHSAGVSNFGCCGGRNTGTGLLSASYRQLR